MADPLRIRIGISACLLGQRVRYDGGHKRDAFLADTFGRFVEWVPVCPEVECGLGTPREPIRLVQVGGETRLQAVKSGRDLTALMDRYAAARLARLAGEDLAGYVFKKDSPSCGLARVKVYQDGRLPARTGHGRFASAVVARFPLLPVEEEGRLHDPRLREHFVERVFAYARLQALWQSRWTIADLVRFHTAHKLALLAHAPGAYRSLGQLVAAARSLPRGELARRYATGFMQALSALATRRRHVNVLQHATGHLKHHLDAASRAELRAAIEDYRRELVPLVVPITLVRHHVRVHDVAYLAGQVYLDPHPKELMLRNHV